MKNQSKLNKSALLENSLFNMSDLTISYSQDFNLTKKQSKEQQNFNRDSRKTNQVAKNVSSDSLPFSSFANITDFFNKEDLQTVKEEESQDNSNSYSISQKAKESQQREGSNSKKNIDHIESSNSTKVSNRESKHSNPKKLFEMKVELQTKFRNKSEDEIKDQLRKIDKEMRDLSGHKNRLKYMLRNKDSNVSQELIETKDCPCCGKTISKLCFHCEHLYCKKETCPRMKKQKLNAKMLQKLKEKKGGENRRFRRSRNKKQSSQQNKKDKSERIESSSDQFQTESEIEYSDNEYIQKQRINDSKGYRLRNREVNNRQSVINFDKTMTEVQLHESNLFVDSQQWQ